MRGARKRFSQYKMHREVNFPILYSESILPFARERENTNFARNTKSETHKVHEEKIKFNKRRKKLYVVVVDLYRNCVH
jgi:hypothetical protein